MTTKLTIDQQIKELGATPYVPPTSIPGNLMRGFVNPLIDLANISPPELISQYAINPLLHHFGVHHQIPKIPHIPGGDPHSAAYSLGEMGSYVLPYAGIEHLAAPVAESGARLISRLARNKLSPRAESIVGTGLKSTMAGGATGAALSSPNNRTQSALTGALMGPAGELTANVMGRSRKFLFQTPAFQKLSSKISPTLGNTDSPLMKTMKAIGENYKKLRGISDENYDHVFMPLEKNKMGMEDLGNYVEAYNNLLNTKGINAEVTPKSLIKMMGGRSQIGVRGTIKKGLTPNEINQMRSDILDFKREADIDNNSSLKNRYGELADALDKDLKNHMKKQGSLIYPAYREAQNFYKTRLAPFEEHAGVKPIIQALKRTNNLEGPNGLDSLIRPGRELSPHSFTPSASSDDMKKLRSLGILLQDASGIPDNKRAAELAKGLIFKDAAPEKGESFDMDQYLKRYNKLHSPQKDFLFSPKEQWILNGLKNYKKSQGKGTKLIRSLGRLGGMMAGGAALGEGIGTHAGFPSMVPALLGGAAGALGSVRATDALTDAATHFIPSSTKGLMALLSPYQGGLLTKKLIPGITTGIGGRQINEPPYDQ